MDENGRPKYLLNSAVVTSPGVWSYRHISLREFTELLPDAESFIGFKEAAKAITVLTGIDVPVNRTRCDLEEGESALIFRLAFPPGTKRPEKAKGGFPVEFLIANSEIGILEKLVSDLVEVHKGK